MMDDINYRLYLHKKKYGYYNYDNINDIILSNSNCSHQKNDILQCFENNNNKNNNERIPYYNEKYSKLQCINEMNNYQQCIQFKLNEIIVKSQSSNNNNL